MADKSSAFAIAMMRCLWALILTSQLISSAIADSPAAGRQIIHIPPGDLVACLEQLAEQSGIEFVYDAEQLKGIKSHGVSGEFSPKEAVAKLLEVTPLNLTEHGGALLIAMPPDQGSARSLPQVPNVAPPNDAQTSRLVGHNSRQRSDLSEIVVTGTHILGKLPVGSALIVYSRADIEQSGSATLEQFARQMPQNFSGADALATAPNTNANFGLFQQGATYNIFGGAGFDLHGLGPASTLTLLNGHRLAPGALDGSLVDISLIPLSAIDRIEVLNDGASAIYGSDAVAGVVNIITRQSFEGAESSAQYAEAAEGGAQETGVSQLWGHSWTSGSVLLDYDYNDQGGLEASQRDWIGAQGGRVSLLPENRRNSAFVTGHQSLGSATTLSANVFYSDRSFKGASVLDVANSLASESSAGHATESAATLSLDRKLFADWRAVLTGDFSGMRQAANTAGSAPGYGVDDSLTEQRTANSDLDGVDFLGSGSLVRLPGGTVKSSLGGSYRTEHFQGYESSAGAAAPNSLKRQVASAYVEAVVPVFGSENAHRGVRRLELSAAVRYDHYTSFGSTTNPKFGVVWEPMAGLRFRGTAGSSFQAPLLSQLGSPVTSNTALIPNGNSPNGLSDILEINGGNRSLSPERSTSMTAGMDVEPATAPGLALSMTYFYTRLKDQIEAQNITSEALLAQPRLAPFLELDPPLSQVQPFFSGPGFQGDYAGLGPSGVAAIFDNQFANIASTIESSLDFSVKYQLPTTHGEFNGWLSGTHLLTDRIQTAIFERWIDVDNTIAEPTSWKVRSGAGWANNGFTFNVAVNYVNAYRNTLLSPSDPIGSWTTTDLSLIYKAASHRAQGVTVALSVQNLADRRPPYVQIPGASLLPGQGFIPFDGTNASPVGRLILLRVTKDW